MTNPSNPLNGISWHLDKPSNPEEGDTYYNMSKESILVYTDGEWYPVHSEYDFRQIKRQKTIDKLLKNECNTK